MINRDALIGRITCDPEVLSGKPAIRGSRIAVSLVVRRLAAGIPVDELLLDWPHLDRDDIAACLLYAAEGVDHPILVA